MGAPPQRCINLYRDEQVAAWNDAVVAVANERDVDAADLTAGDVVVELASAYCGFEFSE